MDYASQFAHCQTSDEVLMLLERLTDAEHQRHIDAINGLSDAAIAKIDALADQDMKAASGGDTVVH